MQKTIWHRRSIPQITPVFLFVAAASLATAAASKSQTFSLPESILLFGNYEDLRVVTPDGDLKLRPPIDVGYNGGYFAFPGISPRGDGVAWGFAVAWQESGFQNGVVSSARPRSSVSTTAGVPGLIAIPARQPS